MICKKKNYGNFELYNGTPSVLTFESSKKKKKKNGNMSVSSIKSTFNSISRKPLKLENKKSL